MNRHSVEGQCEALIAEIETLQTQFDVLRFLKRACELFRFRYFLVMHITPEEQTELSAHSIVTNWPAELIGEFDRRGMMRASRVVTTMRGTTRPVVFAVGAGEGRRGRKPRTMAPDTLMRKQGVTLCVAIPVHDAVGRRAMVCFDGDRPAPSHGELAELNMLAIHTYHRLVTIEGTGSRERSPLTEREKACLAWTAEGRTSSQIADILGLSEHTVNHYLNRAARKLDTVNRTQAVAKALRRGWID